MLAWKTKSFSSQYIGIFNLFAAKITKIYRMKQNMRI